MSVDRSWMKRRVNPDDGSVTQEFKDGVKEFLEFAFNHQASCRPCEDKMSVLQVRTIKVAYKGHDTTLFRDETGIDPTEIELFERVHKLNKGKGEWCDARAQSVHSKYHDIVKEKNTYEVEISDEGVATDPNPPLPAPPAFDAQAWVNSTGDPQKNVYGFGLTKEAEKIHRQVKPSSTKQSTFHASTSANNESNNESEIISLKKENTILKASIEQILKALNMQQVNRPSNE
ncbi:peptidase S8, subtilisin-related protein [Tanacetum coccineum]